MIGKVLRWISNVAIEIFTSRRARVAWQDVATRKGLVVEDGSMFRMRSVRGACSGCGIVLEGVSNGKTIGTRLTVDPRGRLPRGLALESEGFVASIRKALGGQDVEVGDGTFDASTLVRGDEAATLAVLGAENRGRVRGALACGVRIGKGVLVREWPGYFADADAIVAAIDQMTSLGAALSIDPDDVPARLADRVRDRDAEPDGFRRRALETLAAAHLGRAETAAAARAALSDPSPEIRATAATALGGDEGRAALEAIALDAAAPEAVRARAIDGLALRFDAAPARDLVTRVLASSLAPGAARLAAIRAAGTLGATEAAPRLAAIAGEAALDAATAEALADALGSLGDSRGEAATIALLASPESRVRVAAARALERIGGRNAVEPLLPLTRGLVGFGEEKSAAQSAIRAIQSRLGPLDRGGLALSDALASSGALSEPGAPEGGLSLPETRRRETKAG